MKTTSQTAYIVGHIWLVGSFGVPPFASWWARGFVILIGAVWIIYAMHLQRKGKP